MLQHESPATMICKKKHTLFSHHKKSKLYVGQILDLVAPGVRICRIGRKKIDNIDTRCQRVANALAASRRYESATSVFPS